MLVSRTDNIEALTKIIMGSVGGLTQLVDSELVTAAAMETATPPLPLLVCAGDGIPAAAIWTFAGGG